jgi:hypothetical protein
MPRFTSMLEPIYFVWLLLTLILGRHKRTWECKILSQHQTSHGLICSLPRLYLGVSAPNILWIVWCAYNMLWLASEGKHLWVYVYASNVFITFFLGCSEKENLKIETLEDQYIIVSPFPMYVWTSVFLGLSSLSSDHLSDQDKYAFLGGSAKELWLSSTFQGKVRTFKSRKKNRADSTDCGLCAFHGVLSPSHIINCLNAGEIKDLKP